MFCICSILYSAYSAYYFYCNVDWIERVRAFKRDDELPQEDDDPADNNTMPQTGPPIVQQPILQQPPQSFDFSDFMRHSGGSTDSMFSVIREVDALLPTGPIVVYSERAGGSMR